jgi:hypothetical protein
MIDGARHAQRQRFARDLIVPARFVVGVKENVRVAFDKSRRQRRARQVHQRCARVGDRRSRTRGVDAAVLHPYRPSVMHRLAIEHPGGSEKSDGARLLRARRAAD